MRRHIVMAGLVPAIHVVQHAERHVDARDKPGHDGVTNVRDCLSPQPVPHMKWPYCKRGERRACMSPAIHVKMRLIGLAAQWPEFC